MIQPFEAPRFIADAMLGRLARWLRVLGYDTAYEAHIADVDLVRQARHEGRILLTRDRTLLRERPVDHALLVDNAPPLAQLRQVVRQFDLPWRERLFSRCMLCNTPLQPISPQAVSDHVPLYVRQHQQRFVRCPDCMRIYWEGTHVTHMRNQLQYVLSNSNAHPDAPPLQP
jgi:uncharacterized protein with PIN domain